MLKPGSISSKLEKLTDDASGSLPNIYYWEPTTYGSRCQCMLPEPRRSWKLGGVAQKFILANNVGVPVPYSLLPPGHAAGKGKQMEEERRRVASNSTSFAKLVITPLLKSVDNVMKWAPKHGLALWRLSHPVSYYSWGEWVVMLAAS